MSEEFDPNPVELFSWWLPKVPGMKKEPYKVIDREFNEIVATTIIRTETNVEDSLCWYGPLEDFLSTFRPMPMKGKS